MSKNPPTTQRHQPLKLVPYTPSPSPAPPASPSVSSPAAAAAKSSVAMTYRIVSIKPTDADWLTPRPSDVVRIMGPVSEGRTVVCDEGEKVEVAAAAEDGGRGLEIPCAAQLAWGDRSISLKCLYHSSAARFTDVGECADETVKVDDEVDCVNSVGITMQDAILRKRKKGDGTVEDEDVRDDNGIPFMVLHVNKGLDGSARLYCKKVSSSRNGLKDGSDGSLGPDKKR